MPLEQTWVQLESPAIEQGQMSFSYMNFIFKSLKIVDDDDCHVRSSDSERGHQL